MNIANVVRGDRGFTITFSDQSDTEFPFIWLRDNDPDDFHPDTRERVFDLTTVELDIEPADFESSDGLLSIHWPDKDAASSYAGPMPRPVVPIALLPRASSRAWSNAMW